MDTSDELDPTWDNSGIALQKLSYQVLLDVDKNDYDQLMILLKIAAENQTYV